MQVKLEVLISLIVENHDGGVSRGGRDGYIHRHAEYQRRSGLDLVQMQVNPVNSA